MTLELWDWRNSKKKKKVITLIKEMKIDPFLSARLNHIFMLYVSDSICYFKLPQDFAGKLKKQKKE